MIFLMSSDYAGSSDTCRRIGEIDYRRQRRRAEYDVSSADVLARIGVNLIRSDDDVREPVAVYISFIYPYSHSSAGLRSVDRDNARRRIAVRRAEVGVQVEVSRAQHNVSGATIVGDAGTGRVPTCSSDCDISYAVF